ncbi:MAG: aminotransferase class V-fold PLP-dependent enzyme [Candidatus Melainabacteria bacterium]|nr:aminotransferase class V-fold PLP-dependent enzyme [Candidatus Melainabacteria bacterium]
MTDRTIDLNKVRNDTPGVSNRLHFNNAGAALQPKVVTDAVIGHIELESKIGGYEAEEQNHDKIEMVYGNLAKLLNCQSSEIAFVENATRAWDMAFYSLPLKQGDVVLTGFNEYASNYIAFLQQCRKNGAEVKVVPNDEYGQLDVKALKGMIDDRTKLIAITHVATNGGLVNPAKAIGDVAAEYGITYLLDACQSVGQMSIDVQELNCDLLSATGRKYLRAPRGTGFLYVRNTVKVEPVFLDLHAAQWTSNTEYKVREDARRFENWEQNFAGKLGLAVAIEYLLDLGIDAVQQRVFELAKQLRDKLSAIDGITLGDVGEVKCGICTFYSNKIPAPDIVNQLAAENINTTYTTVAGTRLDMTARNLPPMVRASVHYYNSEAEIETFCDELARICR